MTGERVLPNLGLTNLWAVGSDGYNIGMDADLAMLDALLFLAVKSATTAVPPASPAAGDRYIVPVGGTGGWAGHGKAVAVFVDAAWVFYTPRAYWRARVVDAGGHVEFNGTAWATVATDTTGGTTGGTTVAAAAAAAAAALPIPLAFTLPGKPPAGQTYNVPVVVPMSLPENLAGTATCDGAHATANAVFTVNKISGASASTVGTITIKPGGASQDLTELSSQPAVTFAAGDILQLVAPAPADATLADIGITLLAQRT